MLTLKTCLNNVQLGLVKRPNEAHVKIPRAGVLLILKDREQLISELTSKESQLRARAAEIDQLIKDKKRLEMELAKMENKVLSLQDIIKAAKDGAAELANG